MAGELYGLPPDEFTPARNARAAEARSAGDRELAAAIKKLRRPATGAWLANLLVRQRPEQVAELIDLGAAMRRAQAELAGDDLRRLSRQRRQVVGALSNEARQLVRDLGRQLSEASARELEATLEAAIADPGAAEELRQGRLTSALRYSGFGLAGLTGAAAGDTAPAGPATETAFQPARRRPPATAEPSATGKLAPGKPSARAERPQADRRSRERLQAAQRELRAAETEAAAADREAAKRERRVRDARAERDRLRRQLASLERRLRDLREAEERAEASLLDAEEARDAADRKARGSRDRAARARTALGRLTPPGP